MTPTDNAPLRGRPRKTSRQKIIESSIKLLTHDSSTPLSINGVARFMGIAPMGLYRYFEDINDLRQAVGSQILSKLKTNIKINDPWEQQLTSWAMAIRRFFIKTPYLLTLIGWEKHISSSWLEQIATLARILKKAGFSGRSLTEATVWTSRTLVGAVSLEVSIKHYDSKIDPSDLNSLPPDDVDSINELIPHLNTSKALSDFKYCLECCIEAITQKSIKKIQYKN